MKVLHINALYPPDIGGGAEVALAAMAQGFRRRGQDVAVLTTHGGTGVVREQVEQVPVYRVGQKNLYAHFPPRERAAWARTVWHAVDSYNLPMARQAETLMAEIDPDVIVCHNLPGWSVAVWGAAHKLGIPLMQVLHDYYSLCPKVSMFRHGQPCAGPCGGCRVFRLPHRSASQAVQAVVGVSQAVLDTHLQHGLFAQAGIQAVVHNARSWPAAPERAIADGTRPFTFGFIGALTEIKGVQVLAQAFERIARQAARPVRLLIAGKGKDDHVAQLRRDHPSEQIRFVGHVNPAEFFADVDVCVVPSLWHEPLGLVVFEAIASGVPVIGSRRGGIPEIIQHEVNGLLFDPSEPEALDRCLLRLLDDADLLQAMRRVGPSSVAPFLDEDRMLDDYEALFRRLMGAARGLPLPSAVTPPMACAEAPRREGT